MALKVCILASGSSGNCTYVASEQTAVLIDAGLSGRRTVQRLSDIGADLSSVNAVCVSHEHSDHTASLRMMSRRHGIPLYANAGTVEALTRSPDFKELPWNIFTTGQAFAVGDLMIEPFSVPHDAYDPVGFVVNNGTARIGVVTDMGMATTLIRDRLRLCQALVVEANHDEQLLQDTERPWSLKQRIMGRQGHLSNQHAAEMLVEIATSDLQHVFLAHLSEDCNSHDLATQTVRRALDAAGHTHVRVSLTFPDRVSEVCNCA